jgi:hypothetical protein
MDTVELSYRFNDRETGEKEPVLIPVATPFGVPARLRLAEQGEAFGLRVMVEDMGGQPRAVDFDRADLARLGAAETRSRLFAAGLRTEGDGEVTVIQALKAADPQGEIVILRRPGWHRLTPGLPPVFLTPTGEVIGAARDGTVELQAGARLAPAHGRAGELAGWQAATRAALQAPNCPHWLLGILGGLAGTIVDLVQLDSCGINLSGPSSRGKSTAQRLAASAWSSPRLGAGGLFRSMRVSENAVEAWAEQANGTVLVLDDLAHCDGRAVARLIYALAGGVGKGRMCSDTSIRPSYRWATFTLLSAEHSLEETMRRAGGSWQTGMAVRIADVDVTSVNAAVDGDTLTAIGDIDQHFGHAGPAFVRALIADGVYHQPERLREHVLSAARRLAGNATSAAMIRAATPFAVLLVAGELARVAGMVPSSACVGEAVHWAWERFTLSSDALALDPAEQAIGQLQLWLLEHWDVTVKHVAVIEAS